MTQTPPPEIITIDGPAASGKTTIGKLLAHQLGYLFLDTGSMYRAVTLAVLQKQINVHDEEAVSFLAQQTHITILPAEDEPDGRAYTVQLNGQDVTWAIRSPEVEQHVSQISKYPAVRAEMVRQQRQMGQVGRVVMVGRDIGTVVLPNAPLKLYITASPEERARRRLADHEGQGVALGYEEMLQDIVRRDGIDGGREHSPMKAAEDALLVDSSDHTPEQLVTQILNLWQVKHEV